MKGTDGVVVERTSLDLLIALRMAVLRPTEADSSRCVYPMDRHLEAWHYRALVGGHAVAMVSLLPDARQFPDGVVASWRIRGLGVVAAFRGRGLAHLLLARVIEDAAMAGRLPIWGSGRLERLGLYEEFGAVRTGAVYEIAGTGVHQDVVMRGFDRASSGFRRPS